MSSMKTKPCGFNCGTELYWNTEMSRYYEVDTDKPHFCPNYVKGKKPDPSSQFKYKPTNSSTSTNQTSYTPKPKEDPKIKIMGNSYTHLTGPPSIIELGYERLSDIIRDAGGKIHGSQRGVDEENKMDLIVYWEVPLDWRPNVKESINQMWERDD